MNNRRIAIFVSVVIITCVHTSIVSSDTPCEGKNPFLEKLKRENVVLYKQSQKYNSYKCGEEWRTFGTCCEEESLIQHAKRDSENIINATQKVANNLIGYSTIYLHTYRASFLLKQMSQLIFIRLSPIQQSIKNVIEYMHQKEAQKFLKVTERIAKDPAFLKDSLTRCMNEVSKVRAGANCGICSGRSSAFFEEDKVLITTQTCDSFVSVCSDPLRLLFEYLEEADTVIGFLARNFIGVKEINKGLLEAIKKVDEISKEIMENKVLVTLGEHLKDQKNEEVKAELCAKMFKVSLPTIVQEIDRKSESFWKRIFTFTSNIFTPPKTQNKSSNWLMNAFKGRILQVHGKRTKTARNLQEDPNQQTSSSNGDVKIGLFQGDAKVMRIIPVDSSYMSYQGATGTVGSGTHIFLTRVPLNTSLLFP